MVQAQSIVDAQRVQFTPSADDGTIGSNGLPLVQSYTLTVYGAGSSTSFATANLGKPTPDSTGLDTVIFSTLLSTPLQVGVIYEATVSAVGPNGSSESARSNTFELTTTCASTVSPTTLNVGAGTSTGSIGVTATCAWAALSNATWLTITSGASGTGNGSVGFSVAANPLTTPLSGTLTVAGNTVTINQAAGTGPTVPGAPTAVTGTAANTQVSLTWTAPSSNGGSAITGYRVQQATSATGPFSNAAGCSTTSTTTACTATGLTNGTTYFFQVAAINAIGTGSFSGVSSGVTPVSVPGAPTAVTGTAGNTHVSLTWTAPSSNGGSAITGYQVQVATSATGTYSNAAGCATTSTTTSCTATGLTNGTTYFFKVAAINANGTGGYSTASSGVTPVGVPGAPTGVSGAAGNTQVSLTWTAPSSTGGSAITGYQVQVATSATGTYNNAAGCATTSTTAACTATGLTNGTTYFFKVAAINAVGTGSFSSVSSGITPVAVPGTPTNVAGTPGNGQVALTWLAPSPGGSPITGYRVQVATNAGGPYVSAAGCPTASTSAACTATGLTNGTTYFFEVAAINAIGTGIYSVPSSGIAPVAPPTLTIDRTTLNYGATTAGTTFASQTPAQIVHLTQNGSGTVTWTASSNNPWLTVSPTSGTGSAILTVSVAPPASMPAFGSFGGSVTVTATGTSNTPGSVVVTLQLLGPGMSAPPFGSFDTPTDGTTGVNGSLPVTGWALDDEAVAAVRILRDPVAGEPPGQLVMIGNATFIDGARPDVAAANASRPLRFRGGWGYLMLTNMLPNQGNGTFTLYAYADDVDGHTTLLGTKTLTVDNADATAPFGAIDTPGQGATVSGLVANFGWVLAHGQDHADPPSGGTVTVFIDGAAVGTPGGWTSRSDLSALFPAAQYSGINTAMGVFSFDSTTLADGVHTIAWIVTDTEGHTAGVGSRFFSVFNGTNAVIAASVAAPTAASVAAAAAPRLGPLPVGTLPADTSRLLVQRGGAATAPVQPVAPGATGGFALTLDELEPVTVTLDDPARGTYTAYLRGGDGLDPLPLGAQFDAPARQFTWHPGPGFVGRYDLVFVRSVAGTPVAQVDVTITLLATGARQAPHVVIDTPQPAATVPGGFLVAGWAFDGRAPEGTGVDDVEVWAYADDGANPIYLGQATLGGSRLDVAAVYGARAGSAGYQLAVRALAPGGYTFAVFGHSTVTGTFLPAATVHINVQ